MSVFYGISCSAQKQGYVVTISNDTLKGIVSNFLQSENSSPQIPLIKVEENKTTKSIDVNSIRNINFLDKKGGILTYNIFENQLCRVSAQKGDISICKRYHAEDVSSDVDNMNNIYNINAYTDIILFIGNKKKILVYGGSTPYKYEVAGVLSFINALYHKKFSIADFNDEMAMFNYILSNINFLSDSVDDTTHTANLQTLLTKRNMKICKSVYSPFENLSVLNDTNSDIGTYKAADYLEDINIYSYKDQKSTTMYSGDLHASFSIKEKIVLQFINTRYNLNLSIKNLLTYIDRKKDFEHQSKLFDFILNKEMELEQK